MKEHATDDYPLDVHRGDYEFLEDFGEFIQGSYRISVNRIAKVAVLPELPKAPWPPSFPDEWDRATSRDVALRYAFAVTMMVVAPALDGLEERRVVVFRESELPHTAFWIDLARHRALTEELEELTRARGPSRRSVLAPGAVAWLLSELLPAAELDPTTRRLLCIPDREAGLAEAATRWKRS
ncbi:MAG: hypothetical protein R3B06_00810 [Kofleriaceae bacterium]